ncbi:DUF397 domain-containing protein [Marinitenerispora sediminis]|uniref:DUF397 domain-containing protein n=1 Tax=Marinitenerispora sediminis TaxID=1931232 RepID=A0A368T8I4_9ACTN|nr:DUF397 domain-containing protein [Marinitenerispora sediminis]RCV57770.1 DUF397 domain-containing protein [Marinitenerispora sediminis]RCV57902.1 DUF397 domain-containing protein [Marinitenerispora sediminis]RCV60655.1 DUF397 domain-containing protein [Marinitenerispora sediminis]
MQNDIYHTVITSPWTAFCGGNNEEEENETCVWFAEQGDVVAIRDTKHPDRPELRFTRAEVQAFVRGYARQHRLTS